MQKYTKKRNVHYWDTVLGLEVPSKGKDTITLDSTLERDVYIELLKYSSLINIGIHLPLKFKEGSWIVDFVLQSKGVKGRRFIQYLLNYYGYAGGSGTVFLEVKGVQDKNFLDKMNRLIRESPHTSNSLILVGYEGGGFYHEYGSNFHIKPILPLTMFSLKLAEFSKLL